MHRQVKNGLTGFMLLTGSVIAGTWSASAAAQSGTTPQVQTVQVKLKEWSLGMQTATIKAATARFEVENDGQYPHAFKLEGKLGNQSFELATPVLRAGEKSVLIVKLPPGTYEADCPVGDHEMRGMKNTVTFQKPQNTQKGVVYEARDFSRRDNCGD